MEDPEVFEATHALVLALVAEGVVDGLRVDHPDGLADPAGYLRAPARRAAREHVWVEKILDPDERAAPTGRSTGTVGYEFPTTSPALFVDPAGEEPLTALCEALTRRRAAVRARSRSRPSSSRRDGTFAPEVERLRAAAADASPATLAERARARCRSTAPTSSRARPVADEDRAAIAAAGVDAALRGALLLDDDGRRRVRHALPADDAAR